MECNHEHESPICVWNIYEICSRSVHQVAVHSFVETLFRSIWGTLPNSRVPLAVKYFFDFLDVQAERKKISDPDVLHIWKTNRCRINHLHYVAPPDHWLPNASKVWISFICSCTTNRDFQTSLSASRSVSGWISWRTLTLCSVTWKRRLTWTAVCPSSLRPSWTPSH